MTAKFSNIIKSTYNTLHCFVLCTSKNVKNKKEKKRKKKEKK